MALQDRLKKIYKKRICQGPYVEQVLFTPHKGKARVITVSFTPDQQAEKGEQRLDSIERGEVFAIRDEDDADVGGIADLFIGESITRIDNEMDQNKTPFTFNGEILESGRHYLRAVFERQVRGVGGR